MAVNIGYEILVATAVSAGKKAEIIGRVSQLLQSRTLSIAYAATYSAGTGDALQATISIGSSPDFGILLLMDSAVVGTTFVASLLSQLISVLLAETIVLSHASGYTDGSRTYNVTITIT